MKVIFNGEEQTTPFPQEMTFAQLTEMYMQKAQENQEVLHLIKANDMPIDMNQENELSETLATELEKIEFFSVNPKRFAQQSLTDCQTYIQEISKGLAEAAEEIKFGEPEKAQNLFAQNIEMLANFFSILTDSANILNVNMEEIAIGEDHLSQRIEKIHEVIKKMLEAQKEKDAFLLGDLLEYEMLPLLDDWQDFLSNLNQAAKQ